MPGGRNPRGGAEPCHEPSTPAPELGPSFESIDRCLAWASRELAAGRIGPRVADVLIAACAKMTTRLGVSFRERELTELRALVERQEAAIQRLTSAQQADRFRGVAADETPPQFGRVRATDRGRS